MVDPPLGRCWVCEQLHPAVHPDPQRQPAAADHPARGAGLVDQLVAAARLKCRGGVLMDRLGLHPAALAAVPAPGAGGVPESAALDRHPGCEPASQLGWKAGFGAGAGCGGAASGQRAAAGPSRGPRPCWPAGAEWLRSRALALPQGPRLIGLLQPDRQPGAAGAARSCAGVIRLPLRSVPAGRCPLAFNGPSPITAT